MSTDIKFKEVPLENFLLTQIVPVQLEGVWSSSVCDVPRMDYQVNRLISSMSPLLNPLGIKAVSPLRH